MKKIIALILACTMVFTLAACSGSKKETSTTAASTTAAETTEAETEEEIETVEAKGTIKVGHLLDLTGTEAVTGAVAEKAFNFACEYLEKTTGWKIEVVEGDCQSDSDKAANQAEQMISQGCQVLFGPTQIGHKKAVLAYVADNNIPVVLYNGSPAAFTSGAIFSNDMVVALGGGTAGFPTVMADYLYNEVGLRTVYCFKQDTVGGNNYVDPFVTCFTALGGTVIDNIAVAQGTNDWSAYLTTMMNSDAEAIVGWTSSSDAIAFYNEWYNSGAYEKLPVYATMHGGFADSYIMDEIDSTIADALVAGGLCAPINYAYTINSDYNEEYVKAWEDEFDSVPLGNNLPGSCCQALLCLTTALDNLGVEDPTTLSATDLATALRAAEFDGPEGHTVFTDGSAVATKDVYVVKVVKLDDGSYNYAVADTYEQVSPVGYHFDGTNYVAE